MVGCSGSTRQATWKDDCETYDWSDHVLISSLRLGRERERESDAFIEPSRSTIK